MKWLKKKIASNRGESLLEVLVAILIIVFSSLSLYYAVTASAQINAKAAEVDAALQNEMIAAEQQQVTNQKGTVTLMDGVNAVGSAPVDYTGGEGRLTSYRMGEDD
jgi:type II secretory pathway pseudopilin PulG